MLWGGLQTPRASFRCQRQGAGRSSPELQSACPASPQWGMANVPMDTLDQSAHLHRMPAERPLDMLPRHPGFPAEIACRNCCRIASGMTAQQPNSESLPATPVGPMRRNSSCIEKLLSSGGDLMLRAPAHPSLGGCIQRVVVNSLRETGEQVVSLRSPCWDQCCLASSSVTWAAGSRAPSVRFEITPS